MRTLICVKDILEEANRPVRCPRCDADAEPLSMTTCHLSTSPKGTVSIQKGAVCDTHGYFTFTRQIKAVQMHGKDAQIIPHH